MKTQRENSPTSPGKRPQKNPALPARRLGALGRQPGGRAGFCCVRFPVRGVVPPRPGGFTETSPGGRSQAPCARAVPPGARSPPGGHEARKGLRETWIVKPDEASTACLKVASLDFT